MSLVDILSQLLNYDLALVSQSLRPESKYPTFELFGIAELRLGLLV